GARRAPVVGGAAHPGDGAPPSYEPAVGDDRRQRHRDGARGAAVDDPQSRKSSHGSVITVVTSDEPAIVASAATTTGRTPNRSTSITPTPVENPCVCATL